MADLIGIHLARPLKAELGESSAGHAQIGVEFEILDIEGSKPRIPWYGSFKSEASEEISIQALRNCGWTGIDFTDIKFPADATVSLVIEMSEEYNGKTHQQVKWVNRAGGVALKKKMDAGGLAAFNARMKGKLLAFDQKAGTPPKTAPEPAKPTGDIPF